MSIFGVKKIRAFGLDISDSSIKVAELNVRKGHLHSAVFADVPLPEKTIVNHMIVNEERLSASISKALKTAKSINSKFVVCAVPEAKSFVRLIRIPKMPESEIDSAIPFELEQNIPIPIDQVYIDWKILNVLPDQLEILVTASSKDYIDSLIVSLHTIKLLPVAMEIGSQATARALIGADTSNRNVLIVDIGAQQTSFIIVDHNNPLYTSSIPIAGNSFTESVARVLSMPWREAEKIKITRGLTSQSEQEQGVRQAILPILDNIIDEIKNVIRFFEEHSSQKFIDTILLAGGSSRVPGVMEYITTRINLGSGKTQLRVSQGNAWANVLSTSGSNMPLERQDALAYSTVIGLALKGSNYEAY
jgi:type IV pilus assembly protein PilM